MTEVYAFHVFPKGFEDRYNTVINSHSRGTAKREYMLKLDGCWPDLKYTDLRAKKIGGPQTSAEFKRNAKYRGMPEVRCGDRVCVGAGRGVIVGHNSSANFDVLFDADSPKYAGLKLNVHPSELALERNETTAYNAERSEMFGHIADDLGMGGEK